MDRRTFLGIGAAGALAAAEATLEGKVPGAIKDLAKDKSLKIKFLGATPASWSTMTSSSISQTIPWI